MSRILRNDSGHSLAARPGVRGLTVQGTRFVNSAAKFWPSLIDEMDADYPGCDAVVMDMLTDHILDRELLFPENALQRELDQRQERRNFQEALREALLQFEIMGPPGAVHARLLAGNVERKKCDLPLDCVDADIFPCLLVWLLEWSEIPHGLWSNPLVSGDFSARDCDREINYRFQFDLANKHVSEGLFQRTLTLHFTRRA